MLHTKNDYVYMPILILDEGEDEAHKAALTDFSDVRRTKYLIRFYADKSGSMYEHLPVVLDAVKKGVETAKSSEVEDYDTLIQLICFDNEIHEINEKPLQPAEFLDGFDPDSIQAGGGTAMGKVIKHMTGSYTRANPYIEQGAYGPAPAIRDILITDLNANDSKSERLANISKLSSNQYAQRRQDLLVIHVGDEDPMNNEEIKQLVRGKTENIIQMKEYEMQMENLLAARICQSIISLSDPTYVKNEGAGDNYRDAVKTTDTEKKSAGALSTTTLFQDAAKLREKMSSYFPSKSAV